MMLVVVIANDVRPNNAIDADTVRSSLRDPHGAGHRER